LGAGSRSRPKTPPPLIDEVWQPFLAAGMPVARSREIEESIGLLGPLATEALVAIFGQRMRAQIAAAFAGRSSR
jgi:hypothetical protein